MYVMENGYKGLFGIFQVKFNGKVNLELDVAESRVIRFEFRVSINEVRKLNI